MPRLILLVDDEPASLEMLAGALRRAGHLVITASSGIHAQRALKCATFDIVVTDIFMPDMDGIELIRHICTTGQLMPIIAMSSGQGAGTGFLSIATALGADMVLPKPVLPSDLLRAVEQVAVDPTRGVRRTAQTSSFECSAMVSSEDSDLLSRSGRS
ncbi:MAG: response regulator [Aliidongia sp.]